jgi:hypothetical protein
MITETSKRGNKLLTLSIAATYFYVVMTLVNEMYSLILHCRVLLREIKMRKRSLCLQERHVRHTSHPSDEWTYFLSKTCRCG